MGRGSVRESLEGKRKNRLDKEKTKREGFQSFTPVTLNPTKPRRTERGKDEKRIRRESEREIRKRIGKTKQTKRKQKEEVPNLYPVVLHATKPRGRTERGKDEKRMRKGSEREN